MRRKSEYGVDGATLRQRRLPVRDEPATPCRDNKRKAQRVGWTRMVAPLYGKINVVSVAIQPSLMRLWHLLKRSQARKTQRGEFSKWEEWLL